jgi:hypothetical protein
MSLRPSRDPTSQHERVRAIARLLALAAPVLLAGGIGLWGAGCCSDGSGPNSESNEGWSSRQRRTRAVLEEALASAPEVGSEEGLVVRLAFDAGADLDLFVTDPLHESVYFGNSPSGSGGVLRADRRCDDPTPRIEEVRFDEPLAGRYRVGVDHHVHCKGGPFRSAASKRGVYVVHVQHADRRWRSAGIIERGHFEIVALEFELVPPAREPVPE